MQENFEFVQKGFRILVKNMSGFIGQELSRVYHNGWWNEVLYVLNEEKYEEADIHTKEDIEKFAS